MEKVNARFSKQIQAKIKDLLQQMEEGLKTADPHDCSAYTGWTGRSEVCKSYPSTKVLKFHTEAAGAGPSPGHAG
ncbi:hypothetical protein IHE44_0000536 [Lamprotornis superbus]|uniref:Uncharacterized protein n=1 Tax=Lamprotornis superbus TaxID=245042 RepID=A0A835NIH6_9PASS|nr:hypothetical protein IHE44_0000536 [Lamprotornis superbus]